MLGMLPEPRSNHTKKLSRVERQRAKKELQHLNKEIEMVRARLYRKYETTVNLMHPCVHVTSCHLDTLIVRHQRLQQLTDKPPPASFNLCPFSDVHYGFPETMHT